MKIVHRYKKPLELIACITTIMVLAACAANDFGLRQSQSSKFASDGGWMRSTLQAGKFSLVAFTPPAMVRAGALTIYIEGDGLAWIDSSTPSFDPTPLEPVALRLAMRDPSHAIVYLARPCQYAWDDERYNCSTRYWTEDRFSPEVIEATDLAIDQLKAQADATEIRLVGYSGGGAVAALVAARRHDVAMLVTVAGNLDHALWTQTNRISPLSGSLNAADYWQTLQKIPQQHYVGSRDDNIDISIARSYAARFPAPPPSVTVVPNFTHLCCWEDIWPTLAKQNFGLPR